MERLSSDHKIISVKIHLTLHNSKKQTNQALWHNWSLPANNDIRNDYSVTVRNGLDSLEETPKRHLPNDEYENFVITHLEAEAEYKLTETNQKTYLGFEISFGKMG